MVSVGLIDILNQKDQFVLFLITGYLYPLRYTWDYPKLVR